jgi:Ser/Thr protein kinase RdoA (MazF antagonist)
MDGAVQHQAFSFGQQVARPQVTPAQAAALVAEHWGLAVASVAALPSYEDRNFLVTGALG